jgi:hypothetical protein
LYVYGKGEEKKRFYRLASTPSRRKYPCEIVKPVYEEMTRYPGEIERDEWG